MVCVGREVLSRGEMRSGFLIDIDVRTTKSTHSLECIRRRRQPLLHPMVRSPPTWLSEPLKMTAIRAASNLRPQHGPRAIVRPEVLNLPSSLTTSKYVLQGHCPGHCEPVAAIDSFRCLITRLSCLPLVLSQTKPSRTGRPSLEPSPFFIAFWSWNDS